MMAPATESAAGLVTIFAPLSGVIVPLDRVPDEAFATRLAGDGASIDPTSAQVLAPCDGVVLQVHRAHHALTIDASGLEILIHVGLDTVGLRGAGFTPHVRAGDEVRAGDVLLTFDADAIAQGARSLLTQVVVANVERVAAIEVGAGRVVAGRDVLLRVRLAGAATAAGEAAEASDETLGPAITSDPIVVTVESGLHARPAAVLAAAARRFTADVRVVKGDREANARSVVSIMALEVAEGDTVTLVARGGDARDAITALSATLAGAGRGLHAPVATARPTASVSGTAILAPPVVAVDDGMLHGVGASPGVGVGQIFHLRHDDRVGDERAADPQHERRALDGALGMAHAQLEELQARLAAAGGGEDQAAIFAAHRELLADPELLDRAIADIRGGASAAFAWRAAYTAQADRLVALRSALLAGRATDLRDVGRRVLRLLTGAGAVGEVPVDAIVVAEDLTPSDAASLDRTRVRGLCTTMGSASSHVAILARGLGIPAVAGIDARALALPVGTRAIIDGDRGTLRPGPTPAEEADALQRRAADDERRGMELRAAMEPAVTRDGHRVEVVANIGALEEARSVPAAGGEGVGLLRTEFLFMDRRTAPTEDEQAASYEAIAHALGPDRIFVIRTLDVGGDKPLAYLEMPVEANPFLGERGIRLTLARPELFRAQVRAILRTSRVGKIAIMFPMISTQAEWQAARALVERERVALGVAPIQVGLMIETAAAALTAERFARDADFFSIGTNDLTQYTLAMDRTNPRLAPQIDALHPAVLRLIERTVAGARAHGRWVGICGGLASDLAAIPVLLGLGIDELSADVPIVPAVKARVRALSMDECRVTAQQALDAADGADVRAIIAHRHG